MDGYVRIGTELDTKSFDSQIDYVEGQLLEIEHKLKQADMGFEVGDTQKLEAQYEKLISKLGILRKKQEDFNKADLTKAQKSIENVGDSTSKVIRKLGKWALGIFAIESAYGFVRTSISRLSQYNDKIKTDIEYIQFAVASALQPLIEKLISLAYKLLTYINYIAKAWFGVDLFANASAKAMGNASKNAKQLKKSMAGFDEMNVLNDNGSTGAMGGIPSVDLQAPEGDVPEWIKWIADNKDLVTSALLGIGGALLGVHFGLDLIKSLGIGILLIGVKKTIEGIVAFIKDPSWDNFLTILQGIALVIGGIALLMGTWKLGIIALGAALVIYVIKNWDKIKVILGKVGGWIYENVLQPVINKIKFVIETIIAGVKTFISILQGIFTTIVGLIANPFIVARDTIVGVFNGVKTFFNGFIQVIKSLFSGDLKGVLDGFKGMFKGIMDSLWSIAKAPLNLIIGGVNALIRGLNKVSFKVPSWVPAIGGKSLGFNIKQIPKLAKGGIVNMPNRGVPIGGAITGESGREGVIPLTDSQAMMELGQAIGRYITINANITNTMNGRVISRELQKISQDNDFAFNR